MWMERPKSFSLTKVLLTVIGVCAFFVTCLAASLVHDVLAHSTIEITNASGRPLSNVVIAADDGWRRDIGEIEEGETIRVTIEARSEGLSMSYPWDGAIRKTGSAYIEPRGRRYRTAISATGLCTWEGQPWPVTGEKKR